MSARVRRSWGLFLVGALAGAVGLGLLTRQLVGVARTRAAAELEAQHQEDLRTALYRIDNRFAPLLARAVARTEHSGTIAQLERCRVRIPEGLALADPDGAPPSPALAAAADDAFANGAVQLALFENLPDDQDTEIGQALDNIVARGQQRSVREYAWRNVVQDANNGLNFYPSAAEWMAPLRTGPLVAGWEAEPGDARTLAFARRVEEGALSFLQVFRLDWPALASLLLAEVEDLFPGARLEAVVPLTESAREALDEATLTDRLASLPARLAVEPRAPLARTSTALRATLGAAWLLALAAVAAAGLALRASLADAKRQRRFTSAVTHELRTPLTTFRMYSEMLARGMVPEARRAEYLSALEEESARLAGLVENVLAHARLEDGRRPAARERWTATALIERHRAALERRAQAAGTALVIEPGAAAESTLETDPEAVGQILANLVDNACKYGAPPGGHRADAPLKLTLRSDARTLIFSLHDPGPGVPAHLAKRIFRPFERGERDESDAAPGVGLGLALCRDLARALGGELVLAASASEGAVFELRLPLGASARD